MRRTLALAVLAALCAAAAASAATPAAVYKTKVNGICSSYTPKFKKLEAAMAAAQKAQDMTAYGVAFGKLLTTGLAQDAAIEKVPVPASLRSQMTPIIALLEKVDGYVRAALKSAGANDPVGMTVELTKVNPLADKLNKRFDAAGLRPCGSGQG